MTDVHDQIRTLSDSRRALLEHWLRSKRLPAPRQEPGLQKEYDVVVLGGGLAGLTLALQLRRRRPRTRVLVVEKRPHPVPEAAFKVGESTAEIGAQYLRRTVDLHTHLEADQLPKLGLRVFMASAGNADIAERVEVGPTRLLPVPTFQVDRGRLENLLAYEAHRAGVTVLGGGRVLDVSLQRGSHSVTVGGAAEATIAARWVVDASGRAGVLKRRLGLAENVAHDANAAWFRIGAELDVATWTQNLEWQRKIFPGLRRLSTNHLMGRGYWVWLIPLASGSTSVGIVADPALHPLKEIDRFERALAWLWRHEPQCAKAVEDTRHLLQDFHVRRRFAYGCRKLFSADRWALTGEAGVFLDPLYSPGSDGIAMSNDCITDLVVRDLAGEPIARRAEVFDWFLLDFWFKANLEYYEGQYGLMGNPQVMTAKVAWDSAFYWGTVGFLILHDAVVGLDLVPRLRDDLVHLRELNSRVQRCFREWDTREDVEYRAAFVDYAHMRTLYELHCRMASGLPPHELRSNVCPAHEILEPSPGGHRAVLAQFATNIRTLDRLADELLAHAAGVCDAGESLIPEVWLDPLPAAHVAETGAWPS